jgi:REP element-mobilizing transposase RayT
MRWESLIYGMADEHIYKARNKTLLLYHLVFPIKYRRSVISREVGESLKETGVENIQAI